MEIQAGAMTLWFDVDGVGLVPEGLSMRDRPTVLLLHGGPGSYDHSYFKPDFERLAEVAQVVYLDLPGHGRSEWGDPASWTFELAADAVRTFCDALGIERPIVYGHSLGGFVALQYAARNPGHPGALVLQSTAAKHDVDGVVEGFRRAGGERAADVARRVYGGQSDSVTREEWAPVWKLVGRWVPGDEERARIIRNEGLNAVGLDVMRSFDVRDQLGDVTCPTLVCVGDLDPVTPVAAAQEIVDALPAGVAKLEIVEGAGHFTWRDAPDSYWPVLTGFIRKVSERTD